MEKLAEVEVEQDEITSDELDNERRAESDNLKKKSTLKRVTTLSPLNKLLFRILLVVAVLCFGYMYFSSKNLKIAALESNSSNQHSNVKVTSDIKEDPNSGVLVPEAHLEANRAAIKLERESILEAQGESLVDSTAQLSNINVFDGGFFNEQEGNSEIGKQLGGQSFNLNAGFEQFVAKLPAQNQHSNKKEVKLSDNSDTSKVKPLEGDLGSTSKKTESPRYKVDDELNVYAGVVDLGKLRNQSLKKLVNEQKTTFTPAVKTGTKNRSENLTANTPRTELNTTTAPRYVNPLLNGENHQPFNHGNGRSKYANLRNVNDHSSTSSERKHNEPNVTTGDSFTSEFSTETTLTHNGLSRGLYVGDKMIGEFEHGINSTSPTMFAIVKVSQGPLAGAKIVFRPTLAYDTFSYQSSHIQYKNHQAPFKAILVTPDANLQSNYRSGVDYHTLYNLGMVFAVGMAKGSAEFINQVADEIIISDDQIIKSVEFSPTKLLWSAFGGVADAATPLLEKQLDKPPTVWVNAHDLVGIMMVDNWNAEWAPIINDNSIGIY